MVLSFFKLEMRKHSLIFGTFILLQLILSIIVLNDYDFISKYLLITSVTWTILPIYIFIDLYNEFYAGKEVVIHMIPLKTSTKLLVKSAIFSLGLMLVWSTCLIFEIFNLNGIYYAKILNSSNPNMGIIYFILARFMGCISGPIIVGTAIALSKLVKNKVWDVVIIAAVIIGIPVAAYSIMKLNLTGQGKIYFSIGTTSQSSFKQYAGMLSILVESDNPATDIAQSIYWNNVIFNVMVSVLGCGITSLIFNSRKYEILG